MKIINHEKTAELCKLVNQTELARQCHVSAPLVNRIIQGTYEFMDSDRAVRVLNKLRAHNLVVEEEVVDRAA